MKKLLFIICILFSISTYGQTIQLTKNDSVNISNYDNNKNLKPGNFYLQKATRSSNICIATFITGTIATIMVNASNDYQNKAYIPALIFGIPTLVSLINIPINLNKAKEAYKRNIP